VTGVSGHSRKSVTFERNTRSRSAGTAGHVQTESAVRRVRNTHREGFADEVPDDHVKKKIEAARGRLQKEGVSTYDRLRTIVYAQADRDVSGELTTIVAEMEIDEKADAQVHLIYEARNRYSQAIADGLLQRVRSGRTLFYAADDLLASAGFSLEDEALLEIAVSDNLESGRAEAAASVLGPKAVGRIIQAVLEAKKRLHNASGKYDEAAGQWYNKLTARIAHTPGSSLIVAIRARSAQAGNEEMADLGELICRHPDGDGDRGRPFDAEALAAIGALAEDWGNRMLASDTATRGEMASIAMLATRAPSVGLLGLVKRLLDENLRRYRAVRAEAEATGWREGKTTNEARSPNTHQYQRAFSAINAPETAVLMREYLYDEQFGYLAAVVLAEQWTAANEPAKKEIFHSEVDFSRVEEKRRARAHDPTTTSAEADTIFSAIEPLIADAATENQKKHALALGIIAARLPHGQRDATIQKLISMAPRKQRAALLQNLILSGESVDVDTVKKGLAELFEAAKTQPWILSQDYELKDWLRLLPYANPTAEEASAIVRELPDDHRKLERLEGMIAGFGMAPAGIRAENILFRLAEADPKLYASRTWREAIIRRGTLSSARRFVDLAANGAIEAKEPDLWYITRQLGGLIGEHQRIRAYVYQLLKERAMTPGVALLAQAVAEVPDAEGLSLLVEIEIQHKRSFISSRTIENVVAEHIPSESWKGAYDVVPVPAVELRRRLLAMATDGSPTDAAARCLNQIDKFRDEYGIPDSEPRHPDLASGKPWPMMMPDPDAE
jgi:hypothetical protein